jgi:flagellar assembly protein FliH
MSKVIRTGQVAAGSGIVTLGRAEENLHYDPDREADAKTSRIDLNAIVKLRVDGARSELDQQWEMKLRQEHETTRVAGERQLEKAQSEHQQELERVSLERYDEGHQDGVQTKEEEATEAVERMASLHDALKAERSQILLDAENVVVDLALSLARRVVRVEPAADARVVARSAREALRHLSDRSNLLLKVHPEDLGIARRFSVAWVERVDTDAILRVQISNHVDRGGCMIEGPEENVDARLSTQLETLHEALREQVRQQHAVGHGETEQEETKTVEEEGPAALSVEDTPGSEAANDPGDDE